MKKLWIALAASMTLAGAAEAHDGWRGHQGKGLHHYKHFAPYHYQPFNHYGWNHYPRSAHPYGYYNRHYYSPYYNPYYNPYNNYYRHYYRSWR